MANIGRVATATDTPIGPRPVEGTFPIVGVGASAGGLEAFSNLLKQIEIDHIGMALVLIQHLDPRHTSLLREVLLKTTKMPVEQAEDGMRVEPDHVYVIPPNTCLGICDGLLTLAPRAQDSKASYLPVDHFFRALATERGSRAIGVVLSGTASDGTEGLRAIKEASGITFAQEPASAKFSGMPRNALNAGVVDYCLPIPELARELLRLSQHPYVTASEAPPIRDVATLHKIFELVQAATRVDFSEYKAPTFERRLARRMALRRVDTLPEYLTLLECTPDEVVALGEDALIHVTSFFRDPEVFELLKANVFPAIMRAKTSSTPTRMWVAGCATGEEVYSLAIALTEFLGDSSRPIQIFGTDISSKAIETARTGTYPDSTLRDLTDERRRRHFAKVERGHRIDKSIRDLCVFVQHDLARDPPFARLDLVSCRNVLIYFDQELQKRVVQTFHYALNEPGFLLLGRAENISGFRPLFRAIDRTHKIFTRTSMPSTLRFAHRSEARTPQPAPSPRAREVDSHERDLSTRVDRLLLARYAPPGIVVNEKMEVVQFRGQTGAFLEPAPGAPQNNAMQMARGRLPVALRASVLRAKKSAAPVRTSGIEIEHDALKKTCDVVVIPLTAPPDARDALYLVLFEDPPSPRATGRARRGSKTSRSESRVPVLEQELAATKEYLRIVIAEHGRTSEDLGTVNEELVSGNEELQSMNEELETAKEELQSINEELTTVNDELQNRNHEMTQVNSDLLNLLTTVDIPILILDSERRIRRFTPKARRILNVLAADVGRPFADIRTNIDVPDLDHQVAEILETMTMRESEVRDRDGHWYRLQIRPYKTTDNRIDGAILSLVDINALKDLIKTAEEANLEAERANLAKDEFLATLSHELRTPLASILMRAQLLRRGSIDEAKIRQSAEAIEAGVRVQLQLIDDLLDVSRIVTGRLSMDVHPVDLARVVTAAIDSLSLAVERKSLKFNVDLATSGAQVHGDERRLHQIVTNLLSNAIKFTPKHGTLMASLKLAGDSVLFRLEDTGIGIEPGFLPHVFHRFTQENITTSRAYGGLGLGLAIVRHLVELHRGTVTAESPGKGMGSTFTVSLPRLQVLRSLGPSLAVGPERGAIDISALRGLRILVVDDDRAAREAVADLLGQSGAMVKVAQSSAEALKVVEEFRPELIVCDIAMPGEDGYAFIRRLRALGAAGSGNIPALAFTGLASDEDRERALAAGYQMHVAKPVDIDVFTEAVVALAARRPSPLPA